MEVDLVSSGLAEEDAVELDDYNINNASFNSSSSFFPITIRLFCSKKIHFNCFFFLNIEDKGFVN